jgi:ArsR family transcriptional regulator
MREAGLVTDRRDGMQVLYRLKVPCILRFFDCVEEVERGAGSADRCCVEPRRRGASA